MRRYSAPSNDLPERSATSRYRECGRGTMDGSSPSPSPMAESLSAMTGSASCGCCTADTTPAGSGSEHVPDARLPLEALGPCLAVEVVAEPVRRRHHRVVRVPLAERRDLVRIGLGVVGAGVPPAE